MNKDEITERRKESPRTPVEIKVDLSLMDSYYLTKILNISTGGAFICHEDIRPIGDIVSISFRLPTDGAVINTKAQVCWSYRQAGRSKPSSTGMGVKFLELTPEDQKKIKSYIEHSLASKTKSKKK